MFRTETPITIFKQQINRVQALVPGIRDGGCASIHDARIATRRIREVLPLTHEWQRRHLADDLLTRFKGMGRSLGRVRDADVRVELLRYLEARIPLAAARLVLASQEHERRRRWLMRKLLKRFERLSVESELSRLASGAPWRRSRFWVARAGAWRHQLRRLLKERATGARDAVVHATGVYFPHRAHAARIAIKKFRYAAEIAAQTGAMVDEPLIRALKKAADVLGDLHDRQTLIDDLDHTAARDGSALVTEPAEEIRLVVQLVEAEIHDLHARYLERRQGVIDAADRALDDLGRSRVPAGMLAVAGVVALTGIEAIRRTRSSRSATGVGTARRESEAAVSVRVPVPLTCDGEDEPPDLREDGSIKIVVEGKEL